MIDDIFLVEKENEGEVIYPSLTIKTGLWSSLFDTNGNFNIQNSNTGDICIAAHTLAEKPKTLAGEPTEMYYSGGSLFINTGYGPMFISPMPGEQGIPLVGQGDLTMPKYSPTVKYLGIGCDPALIPGPENTFYGLTVCNKSLFCNNIIFGKVTDNEGTNNFTIGNFNDTSSSGLISATTLRFTFSSGNQKMTTIMNPMTFINGTYTNTSLLHSAQFVAAAEKITYLSKRYNTSKTLATTAQLSVNSTGFIFENTDNIELLTNKLTIDKKLGIVLQAQQKDKPISTITMANGDIQISSPSVNISSNSGQILQTDSKRSGWWDGRDNAMIRLNQITNLESTTDNGYFPALSMKTQNGNWVIGTVPGESSHCDKLIFTYTKDSGYTALKNGTTTNQEGVYLHVKISEEGVIESTALQSRYYGTGDAEYADLVSNPLPGTIYFKIIE